MNLFTRVMLPAFMMAGLYSANAAQLKHTAKVDEFLKSQSIIRLLTDEAEGLGNQSASANLVLRLRQMGFQGKFEFIYPDQAESKIALLFDLPANLPSDYLDTKNNTEFIKLSSYIERSHKNEVAEIKLGMTGAMAGDLCSIVDPGKIDPDHCRDYAAILKTRYFVRMSPFITSEIKDYPTKSDTAIFINHQAEPLYQMNSDNKFIVMPVAGYAEAKSYLNQDARGQALLKQKPVLVSLMQQMEEDKINVLPTYGYHIQIGKACDQQDNNCRFDRANEIMQIILGARYAQINGAGTFQKPLVIPVYYHYQNEIDFLRPLIEGKIWDTISSPGAVNLRRLINQYDLPKQLVFANADDPAAQQQLDNLKNNQIMLISMGSLPKIVFDGFYNHTGKNIWPQIREGANSFNSLILTGKPHMRCSDDGWEIGFNRIDSTALQKQLEAFYYGEDAFCKNTQNHWASETTIKMTGQFILDSAREDSTLSAYFAGLKAEALKPENDRIYYALEAITYEELI